MGVGALKPARLICLVVVWEAGGQHVAAGQCALRAQTDSPILLLAQVACAYCW